MATAPDRTFTVSDAKREHVPLLIGLTGPSGGGKTFSALRLATGIQSVSGGDIYFIDTESRRALHYADKFKFKHVPFDAPFGSLDYLAALQFCVGQGAGVVIVDSMSHEHEGPGGMVDLHDSIVDRMAGQDFAKRERVKMLAWSEPKQKRRALINGILQLNCNFIFCFRAKNTAKPGKDEKGKNAVIAQGFMPIAGEEFVFEQTMNALLLPGAGGVPTWHSDMVGERTMIKLPEQFAFLRSRHLPLDEKIGAALARWASGAVPPKPDNNGQREFVANDTNVGAVGAAGWEPDEPAHEPEGKPTEDTGEAFTTDTEVEEVETQAAGWEPVEDQGEDAPADDKPVWASKVETIRNLIASAKNKQQLKDADFEFNRIRAGLPDDVVEDVDGQIDAKRKALTKAPEADRGEGVGANSEGGES